jgi:sarcosine oxidase subunit beta
VAETAEVVIIGGGIVGSSIAYHLAEAGCADVLIVEREEKQGLGSTGKSAGGVRAQFATPINIRMSLYSIDFFARFEEATGHTADYRPHGYLFLATSQAHLDYLRANREQQMALGLKNVELLSADEIARMIPQLRADDILGGSFCPSDGFVDPYSTLRGFAARARERGVRIWLETEVTGIQVERGAVSGVTTTRGPVAAPVVVNAAGPWAALVARLAGVELPVTPLRRQIVNTQPFAALPSPLPMVIDMSNGFHFRREGEGILMAWPDPEETYGFKTSFEPEFIEKILLRAVNRVPAFADVPVNPHRCWAGMYEVTPDHHAIIGPAPGVRGLFLANGFSGHGVMHSPATGRILADLILHGQSGVLDAAPLAVDRFAAGRLLEETAVL